MTVATHRVEVIPVRQKAWDAELQTWVLRTIGCRAACACGWRGRIRSTPRQAAGDKWLHTEGEA